MSTGRIPPSERVILRPRVKLKKDVLDRLAAQSADEDREVGYIISQILEEHYDTNPRQENLFT